VAKPHHVVSQSDLEIFISNRDDFAFEREVFHTTIRHGLAAEHAGLYEDPVTFKPRQFDIRARKTVQAKGFPVTINLAIECKSLVPEFPLVVSCVPRASDENYHELLTTATGNLAAYRHRDFYPTGDYVGKSMRQIGKDKGGELFSGDDVFDKWMQALASSGEIIHADADRITRGNGPAEWVAMLPLLVVSDETLWVTNYRSNGMVEGPPRKIEDITFYLGRKYRLERQNLTYTISHLHVCTRSYFPKMLQEIAGGGDIWPKLFVL